MLTIEKGQIVNKEKRAKPGHHAFAAHKPPKFSSGEKHGYDSGAKSRHASMAENIKDCVENIYEAVLLYLKEKLLNLMERLH